MLDDPFMKNAMIASASAMYTAGMLKEELNEDKAEYVVQKQKGGAGEWEDVEKFDDLSKARMCLDKKRSEAESKDCGCKFQITRDGKVEVGPDDDTFGPSQVDESASKNPYAAGMKTVTGGKSCCFGSAPKKAKTVKEADEEEPAEKKEEEPAEATAEKPEDEKTEDAPAEETSAEDAAAEEKPEEKSAEEASEEKPDEDASEETSDTAEDASAEEPAEEKSEEPAEEEPAEEKSEEPVEEEPAEEKAELDDAAKSELKDEYRRVFKATMLKCKFEDKSFNDLTIEEKVTFFEALAKAWTKNQPSEFMSDKENDQLEEIVVKP